MWWVGGGGGVGCGLTQQSRPFRSVYAVLPATLPLSACPVAARAYGQDCYVHNSSSSSNNNNNNKETVCLSISCVRSRFLLLFSFFFLNTNT